MVIILLCSSGEVWEQQLNQIIKKTLSKGVICKNWPIELMLTVYHQRNC